ncbi:MAG: hypothetical protein A2900_01220 [Candidatus Chisholmbacteria bacterium RIFCSPLOWO2_01_FULL_50_28]|uniref:WbqC-like protein n=1 Tax=Candidatus Chisholmbacteria bacterium RIFCSPHIGHO2_01_FULL_52_32 TaxID=1797591 RepID=A0A1G1VUY4_9BACT|nr:MAG: hypothetical protein A2786_06280 [Candidatus Chisholmbacteria bacterium RIFCSPHIGHO2_01_FULL_52_32]OGY19709.1 MAG: hypothetical protein A2900_01220 [Candidatus Chisholmbacteria bacterium RIFCSPLOWO2_01_FULL_50_28]
MHQPEYLPYLGHVAKIALADLYVFYDDVRFEKGGFQNRNRILINARWNWLTVPVAQKYHQNINDVRISGSYWKNNHLKTLKQVYGDIGTLQDIYERDYDLLVDLNISTTAWIMRELGITTPTLRSSQLKSKDEDKIQRVISICKELKATAFVSGIGAKTYINESMFNNEQIVLIYNKWIDQHDPPLSTIHYLLTLGKKTVARMLKKHVDSVRRAYAVE